MRDLDLYNQLCKVDLYNHSLQGRYPYTIHQDMAFTQHEIILQYKQNYCENVVVLEEIKPTTGGETAEPNINIEYEFMVLDLAE